MLLIKLYYHVFCLFKILFYKVIYRRAFQSGFDLSFRAGFHAVVEKGGRLVIGRGVFFNNYCTVATQSSVKIGDGTLFGENVKIYDHNHCYSDPLLPIKDQGYTSAPITIGRHCWIGSNVVILKGVTIGDNCVIGAGCVVYKSIPSGTIVIAKQTLQEKII